MNITRRAVLSIAPVLTLPVLAESAAARPDGIGVTSPGAARSLLLDRQIWAAREGFMDAHSLDGVNLASQVAVVDGQLRLRTERLAISRLVHRRRATYKAGYAWTRGRRHLGYGRTQLRMRMLPAGRSAGMWSGVWFRDTRGRGEIDLCEAIGTPNRRPSYYPIDGTGISQTVYSHTGMKAYPYHQVLSRIGSSVDNWHTYTLDQWPRAISMYVDGKMTFHTSDPRVLSGFTGSLDLRFSQFVGEAWGARPSPTTTAAPNDLVVQWVTHTPL